MNGTPKWELEAWDFHWHVRAAGRGPVGRETIELIPLVDHQAEMDRLRVDLQDALRYDAGFLDEGVTEVSDEKSFYDRVEDATGYLQQHLGRPIDPVNARSIAVGMLEAADAPALTWPTDDTIDALEDLCGVAWNWHQRGDVRVALRKALSDDPVIKATIALRDSYASNKGLLATTTYETLDTLDRVLKEAGL